MKTKLFCFLLLSIVGVTNISGQVTEAEKNLRNKIPADTIKGWKSGGVVAINLAQTSLTNWASGGQNSVAVNGMLSAFANYRKDKNAWDNTIDLGYGLLKQGKGSPYRKTDDKIDFMSKFGREAFKNLYYAALMNFRTQFAPGYNYPNDSVRISKFMAPGYLLFALGMDYKPNAYFSAFLAPITSKTTFVSDTALSNHGAFGVPAGKKSFSEFGGYLRIIYSKSDFKSEFLKNIALTTKIDLFSNYRDKPQNIVVNWENLIAMKVNKFISVTFNTQLIYDDKIAISFDKNHDGKMEKVRSKVQFKEILGVGFSYKF
jgi:hypothetical protein